MKTKLFFFVTAALLLIFTAWPQQETVAQGVKTIVIDPGHGGMFPGAQYRGVKEKDLNLKVALKLGELLKSRYPDIKVVFTRTTDIELAKSLSADLAKRSKIANDAKGDLFISIHANAASNTAAYGAETIIMGESSLEKQRNDAALYTANEGHLVDMSDDKKAAIVRAYIQNLQFTYGQYSEALARLIQKNYSNYDRKVRDLRRQPIMVLYGTDMPCVLTEMGFMSNSQELAYMSSEKGQKEIAESIYGGIREYINMVNRTSNTPIPTEYLTEGYTIQILSSKSKLSTNDSQFKSYRGNTWMREAAKGSYKYQYCVGRYHTRAEAEEELREVRRAFKDAFISAL